ncbi:A24 family peptidase [Tsukamurella serpentis]
MEWGLLGGVALWCTALCWFDVRERRLPNALTLPGAGLALSVGLWCALDGAPASLLGAALWTTVNAVAFLARGMGAGDVKLAPTLGAVVAAVAGVAAVVGAVVAAQAITVVWAIAARDRTVPHGPAMCLGALAVVLAVVSSG